MSNLPTRIFLAIVLILAGACGEMPSALPETGSPLRAARGVASHMAAPQPMGALYGPQQFARTRGAPDVFTVEASTLRFEPPFTIHIRNGAADGTARVAGAEVTLDGNVLLSQRDLARESAWSIPVALGQTASLQIALSGPPGGFLEIAVEGRRSIPVFCPNGPAASYGTLREAIEAVWVDGTVLVCDGEHAVDRVLIDKPLTLRSLNPGGATLADTQPEGSLSSELPAVIIDGVSAGLVRIADLNFLVKNRGIAAGGTFDQVQLDSVRMRGRRLNNSVGMAVRASTVPTAKVEVLRSRFEAHQLGVWPIAAVETDVRWSSFHGMSGGGVVYSGTGTGTDPSASYGVTEYSTFSNCSVVGCVRIVGPNASGREIRIAHNVMHRTTQVAQSFAILVARNVPAAGDEPGPVTIEHNEVAGAPPVGDPADTISWRVRTFLLKNGGTRGAPVLVRHNRITDVHTGIEARGTTTAHDNTFTGGYQAVWQRDPSVLVTFLRNDLLGFGSSLRRDTPGGEHGNYRCNWWGSTAGPQNPSANVVPASYTPWAMQPIANTATPCDQTAPPPPSVVRVCATHIAGGPPTFATVALAYAAVPTAGTILVCDGTHMVQDVRLAKALTIRNEGPGKPTLDASGARGNFDIRDVAGGAVVLRGLRFRGARLSLDGAGGYGNNVNIEGSYRTITIEDSEFFPSGQLVAYDMPAPGQPRLTYNSGVWVWNATGDSILVRQSTFTGGDVGVGGSGAHIRVEGSSFQAQATGAVHRGPAGSTVIVDNDISECGTAWCIGSFSTGWIDVLRNRIRVDAPRQTSRAILADNAQAKIVGNVITGTGGTRSLDDQASFPISFAIAAHASKRLTTTSYTITSNTVSGAYSGIDAAGVNTTDPVGPIHVLAHDNRISDVATPFSSSGGFNLVSLAINRNDFSSYLEATPNIPVLHFSSVDGRCNWWGQPTGPADYPADWRIVLEPWATEPIAGRRTVSC